MKQARLSDLLASHADALNRGEDVSGVLLTEFGQTFPELEGLLRLASLVKQALVPIAPPPTMVARIWRTLHRNEQMQALPAFTRQGIWVGVLGAGLLLSVAGILIWLFRRFRPISQSPIST